MTLVGIALQILLAVLLVVALVFGMRLERRLKALKESHEGFAKAILDLDMAAQRAEQGLADLRAATDEAAEQLADRIDQARALTAKLDKTIAQASRGESARVTSNRPPPAPPVSRARAVFAAVDRPSPPVETPRSRPRGEDDDLFDPPAGSGGFGARPGGRR